MSRKRGAMEAGIKIHVKKEELEFEENNPRERNEEDDDHESEPQAQKQQQPLKKKIARRPWRNAQTSDNPFEGVGSAFSIASFATAAQKNTNNANEKVDPSVTSSFSGFGNIFGTSSIPTATGEIRDDKEDSPETSPSPFAGFGNIFSATVLSPEANIKEKTVASAGPEITTKPTATKETSSPGKSDSPTKVFSPKNNQASSATLISTQESK